MALKKTVSVKIEKKPIVTDDLESLESTQDVFVSKKIVDQVIGQEKAVEVVRKAAAQKRNVLLIIASIARHIFFCVEISKREGV